MFIKAISNCIIDEYGRVFERVTTYGKYKNKSIAIDNYRYKYKNILEKRFVVWDDNSQIVVNKTRKDGKGFERIG